VTPKYKIEDKIESVQKFFTRRICGLEKLSYSERLNILGLETLNGRRVIFDLILCYKYLHGLVEINIVILYVFTSHLELEVTE